MSRLTSQQMKQAMADFRPIVIRPDGQSEGATPAEQAPQGSLRCDGSGSVLDKLYSAHGTSETMFWNVDQSAHRLEIDTGMQMLWLTRAEAMELHQLLNAALPHMAVALSPNS